MSDNSIISGIRDNHKRGIVPEGLYDFVFRLNGVSVPTRYPEDIERLKKDYNKRNTGSMLKLGKETLKWLKRKSEQ
jgi:hypothetical protein